MCSSQTMFTRLHEVVLHDISSLPDSGIAWGSSQTSAHATCDTFVEPDVAQHPVAATTMDEAPKDAYPDVEQP